MDNTQEIKWEPLREQMTLSRFKVTVSKNKVEFNSDIIKAFVLEKYGYAKIEHNSNDISGNKLRITFCQNADANCIPLYLKDEKFSLNSNVLYSHCIQNIKPKKQYKFKITEFDDNYLIINLNKDMEDCKNG